jgi:hypothetical protein
LHCALLYAITESIETTHHAPLTFTRVMSLFDAVTNFGDGFSILAGAASAVVRSLATGRVAAVALSVTGGCTLNPGVERAIVVVDWLVVVADAAAALELPLGV